MQLYIPETTKYAYCIHKSDQLYVKYCAWIMDRQSATNKWTDRRRRVNFQWLHDLSVKENLITAITQKFVGFHIVIIKSSAETQVKKGWLNFIMSLKNNQAFM